MVSSNILAIAGVLKDARAAFQEARTTKKPRLRLLLPNVISLCAEEKKAVAHFPELPAEAALLIKRAWDDYEPPDELFSSAFSVSVTRKDLLTLRPNIWINDTVMEVYFKLIVQRCAAHPDLPKTYAFSTFFFPSYSEKGYGAVRRWTRNDDIFSYDILLVPLHLLKGTHWAVAVVDFGHQSITYYDSVGNYKMDCLKLIANYLDEESKDKKGQARDPGKWKLQCLRDVPYQRNKIDCGVFACKYAEYASRRAPIDFKQAQMDYFRQQMVWEICEKALM